MVNDSLPESSNTNKPLLEALGISHNFDYPLFKDLSIQIYPAQSVAIMGPSGCGKSTLLNILSTFLKPQYGTVTYKTQELYQDQNSISQIRKDEFGVIFQSHYLFRGFSASQNIQIAELISNQSIDPALLKEFKIDHVMHQGVGELSGGQQQRVSIARVLAKQPKILFADEPTGNLDMDTAEDVMDKLFKYIKNAPQRALILITHEEKIARECDKVYRLENYILKEIQ